MKSHKFDITYLKMAQVWATNSHCKRKQVGALIVKDGMIISDGYNGTVSGMDNCCEDQEGTTLWHTIHAEQNAICKLAKSSNSSDGATLYITLSPCKECSKMIRQSGIIRVVYSKEHSDRSGLDFLTSNGVHCEFVKLD